MHGMDEKFISLGPFCLAASILQAADLRDGSYPLDWAQSGYTTIKELVSLSKEAFYYRNIYTPSIHFYQSAFDLNDTADMHRLVPSSDLNVFGYPYFYNPHKRLGEDSKDYFFRTLDRWRVATSGIAPVSFVVADYVNNPGNIFFEKHGYQLGTLSELLRNSLSCRYRILLIRLVIDELGPFATVRDIQYLSDNIAIIHFTYPKLFTSTQELHDLSMRLLAKKLNSCLNEHINRNVGFLHGRLERLQLSDNRHDSAQAVAFPLYS